MLDRPDFNDFLLPFLRTRYGAWFYGNGDPIWKEGKNKKRSQTSKQARSEKRKMIKALRRHGKDNEAASQLADVLASCCKKNRCLSGACPVCLRAAQRIFVLMGTGVIEKGGERRYAVSLVWRQHRFAEGQLDPDSMFQRLKDHIKATLKKAKIRLAIGEFDISMNEHEHGKFSPHWRPHAWILVATKDTKRLKKHLKEAFPLSKRVRRPVRVIRYDHSPAGLAYAMKSNFTRRVSLPRKERSDSTKTRRDTRNRPLRATQKVELALALDQAGLANRTFEVGFETIYGSDESPIIYRPKGAKGRVFKSSTSDTQSHSPELLKFLKRYWGSENESVD